jgi:hypothetical protein
MLEGSAHVSRNEDNGGKAHMSADGFGEMMKDAETYEEFRLSLCRLFSNEEIKKIFDHRYVVMRVLQDHMRELLTDEVRGYIEAQAEAYPSESWACGYDKLQVIKNCREKYYWGLLDCKSLVERVLGA